MGTAVVDKQMIKVRQAPACEPPYDDERHPDTWGSPVQPPLALPPPAIPKPSPPWDTSRATRGSPASEPPGASLAARTAVTRFLHTCLEILNGYRPVAHFRVLCGPLEAADVLQAMTHAVRRLEQIRRQATTAAQRRIRPGRVRLCEPRPGVAEIAAVVHTSTQTWALAVRLEQQRGRWLCTAAHLLQPPRHPDRAPDR